MRPPHNLPRRSALRLLSTPVPLLLSLLALQDPPITLLAEQNSDGINDFVRRAIVRSAQTADRIDGVWQQISGEVVPSWQQVAVPSTTGSRKLDAALSRDLLNLPLVIVQQLSGIPNAELQSKLQTAKQQTLLLYSREFPRSTGIQYDSSNSTVFEFNAYATWRVVQDVLSEPSKRSAYSRLLGESILQLAVTHQKLAIGASPRFSRDPTRLPEAILEARRACGELLRCFQSAGLFLSFTTSAFDSYDADDWANGEEVTWSYVISGSALVGASRLSQMRSAGCSPSDLLKAPLAACLRLYGVESLISEYFLDSRGRPDPRTFSDPQFYSDTLLEIVTL
eukprot:44963-Pleurochrysis_carterae.AAC.1